MERRKKSSRKVLWLAVAAVLGLGALATFRVGEPPTMEIAAAFPGIGRSTPISISLDAGGRGLGGVRVFLEQAERRELVAEKPYEPRAPWEFWGERTTHDKLELRIGREAQDWIEEGQATISVEAAPPGTWLRRPDATVKQLSLPVLLRPPTLGVISSQHYPAQGGSEVVVYRVGSSSVRDGVKVGEKWFPGAALPGAASASDRMALFAVPFDHTDPASIRLLAADAVGDTTLVPFVDRFFPKAYKTDDIEVSEGFMAKVVPEIRANTPSLRDRGDLLENYIAINRELRSENAAALRALSEDSAPEFLWSKAFQQMPNAQVMSAFADRRTYLFEGREVDRQDHLGYDLASVKHAPIPAANSGLVVLAEYFGIYGNAVVIDHGLGLMSLYGHLSLISVEKGQMVERGQVVGKSGETGLAGGDHLHFTMLLRGEAVNPIEWWDGGWIRDRIKRKLGATIPFAAQ